ncbi:hypothetical protein SDC9_211473 [bioreactor metagenome]|uniref:Uncharacterized protein n=1 Tax=bioreactor metagenome TaxID=1076179 RepID=A0A645JJ47_9ZZZZ
MRRKDVFGHPALRFGLRPDLHTRADQGRREHRRATSQNASLQADRVFTNHRALPDHRARHIRPRKNLCSFFDQAVFHRGAPGDARPILEDAAALHDSSQLNHRPKAGIQVLALFFQQIHVTAKIGGAIPDVAPVSLQTFSVQGKPVF